MQLPVTNIVKGHVNELLGINKDVSQIRMNICKECPIFSPKYGGLCNEKLYINPDTDDISITEKKGYVQGCGCRLLAKTTLPDEKCVAGKW